MAMELLEGDDLRDAAAPQGAAGPPRPARLRSSRSARPGLRPRPRGGAPRLEAGQHPGPPERPGEDHGFRPRPLRRAAGHQLGWILGRPTTCPRAGAGSGRRRSGTSSPRRPVLRDAVLPARRSGETIHAVPLPGAGAPAGAVAELGPGDPPDPRPHDPEGPGKSPSAALPAPGELRRVCGALGGARARCPKPRPRPPLAPEASFALPLVSPAQASAMPPERRPGIQRCAPAAPRRSFFAGAARPARVTFHGEEGAKGCRRPGAPGLTLLRRWRCARASPTSTCGGRAPLYLPGAGSIPRSAPPPRTPRSAIASRFGFGNDIRLAVRSGQGRRGGAAADPRHRGLRPAAPTRSGAGTAQEAALAVLSCELRGLPAFARKFRPTTWCTCSTVTSCRSVSLCQPTAAASSAMPGRR